MVLIVIFVLEGCFNKAVKSKKHDMMFIHVYIMFIVKGLFKIYKLVLLGVAHAERSETIQQHTDLTKST